MWETIGIIIIYGVFFGACIGSVILWGELKKAQKLLRLAEERRKNLANSLRIKGLECDRLQRQIKKEKKLK